MHLAQNITIFCPIDYNHPIQSTASLMFLKLEQEHGYDKDSHLRKHTLLHYIAENLPTSQLHYPVHELELLAIVDEVQLFHPQLYGPRFPVVTDNKALSYVLSQTNLPYHQTRGRMFLQSYDFDIIHRPGKDNVLEDPLSRIGEEREASADMILVDPTEMKTIKGPYSAMTSNTKYNLHLAHTQDSTSKPSVYSATPLNPFSVPQHLSMSNTEDVPIPDSPTTTQENDNHPGPIEQGLEQMAATLEQGIDAMQSKKASPQGEPHDPTETTILI